VALWSRSYTLPWKTEFGTPLHNGSIETGDEWAWRLSSSQGHIDLEPVCSFYSWRVTYWKIVALWLILPAYAVFLRAQNWRASRKPPKCSCKICGCDLRATPDRCPECGTVQPGKIKISQVNPTKGP
jgi:hypothetical protein